MRDKEEQRSQLHSLWRPAERKCMFLLQQKNTNATLLQIHAFMLRHSVETNLNIFTKFITACASLSAINHARRLFDVRPQRNDTLLCNSMIKAYLGVNQFSQSFTLYRDLRKDEEGFVPNKFTFLTLAKSCGLNVAISESLQIHNHVLKFGFCLDLYVSTALLDMYAKLGIMGLARKVFEEMPERSVVSWTALICGYAKAGDMERAKKLLDEMPEEEDSALYNAMIDGYVKSGDLDSARGLFDRMPDRNVISWTSMINGYCNSGDVVSARVLFDSMPEKNLVSWNAMIAGYCRNRQPHEALKLFHEMQSTTSVEPDRVTIVSILPPIADLGALELGEWVHRFVRRKKLDRATNVCTALVDMYAKCGEMNRAKKVFDEMPEKEIASWNALINGYAVNGCAKEALEVFLEMQNQRVLPNDVTMIGVLSACNHAGLVKEGKSWFKAMAQFRLTPKIEHYGCMVDMLGRAGCVDEAEKLIESMPYEANVIILTSLLFAYWSLNNVLKAERVLNKLVRMEPTNHGSYVMLRSLYAAEKRWEDVEGIRREMRRNGARKEAGCSVIEVNSLVSEFVSGDKQHPKWEFIQSVLLQLLMHTGDNQTWKLQSSDAGNGVKLEWRD
ncbi:ABA hypersensitive germination 11 [Hibiscus trionum]|uniref:ABA hypersensitive germination 11 n=1 Tax=Hibiscus trionum TaxID=183268 RepID=A0A9W7LQU2_HIBTR|nr:ABA hypersensitive germination 11 [Hibiscus trionum]